MSTTQLLGAAMMAVIPVGMYAGMVRHMGWKEASRGFAFAIGVTAFAMVGALLTTGRLP